MNSVILLAIAAIFCRFTHGYNYGTNGQHREEFVRPRWMQRPMQAVEPVVPSDASDDEERDTAKNNMGEDSDNIEGTRGLGSMGVSRPEGHIYQRYVPTTIKTYNQGWGYGGFGGNSMSGYWNYNKPTLNFPTQSILATPPAGVPLPTEKPLNSLELIAACIRSCPVTSEYSPVCGTNEVTYVNLGRLECAKSCGVEVQLSRQTACSVPSPNPIENINTFTPTLPIVTSTEANSNKLTTETIIIQDGFNGNNANKFNESGNEIAENNNNTSNGSLWHTEIQGTEENNNTISNDNRESDETGGVFSSDANNSNGTGNGVVNGHQENNNWNEGNINGLSNKSNISTAQDGTTNLNGGSSVNVVGNGHYVNNVTTFENISTIVGNSETNVSDTNTVNSGIIEPNSYNIDNNDKEDDIQGQNNWNSNSTGYSDYSQLSGSVGIIGNSNIANIGNSDNLESYCNSGETPSLNEVMACTQLCPLTPEYNPVCGSDGITYTNPGRLLCSQFCGIDVKVRKFAPCASPAINYFECPTYTNPPATNNPGQVTPPMPSIQACMEACPVTSEYKPVCGSNNITYKNVERLQCVRNCGIDVFLKKHSECEVTSTSPTPPTGRPIWPNTERPTLPLLPLSGVTEPSIVNCMIRCTPSHENSPVCGTDNNTYVNVASLNCAKRCGVNDKSDRVERNNLLKAKVHVKSLTACPGHIQATTNPPKPGYVPGVTTNFTIPSDVLSNIFPEDHPALPVTPDESEEFEIDKRRPFD